MLVNPKKTCSLKMAVPEFSIFLKSTCLLLAIFLKFIFNQKGKSGLIWIKFSIFYFKNIRSFIKKKSCSLKVVLNFENIKINNFHNPIGVKLLTATTWAKSSSRAKIQKQFSRYTQSTLQLRKRNWKYFSFSPFMSELLWRKTDPLDQNWNLPSWAELEISMLIF